MNKIDQIQTQIDYIDTRLAAVLLARQTAGRQFLNAKEESRAEGEAAHACDKLDMEKKVLLDIRVTLTSEMFRLTQERIHSFLRAGKAVA